MIPLCRAIVLLLLLAGPGRAADNELTEAEKADGWRLLFDGRSTNGWLTTAQAPAAASHVQDGCINPHPCNYMLIAEKPLENFVLTLDFKLTPKCNSGVFVRTWPLKPREGKDVGFNGIEIAIDATPGPGLHTTGAIYDLVPTQIDAMKPVGEWNHLQITADQHRIEVELNGRRVSEINLDEWTEPNKRPNGTDHKFDIAYKDHPRAGFIGLQDHGSDCWYRNIKVKDRPPTPGDRR